MIVTYDHYDSSQCYKTTLVAKAQLILAILALLIIVNYDHGQGTNTLAYWTHS